MVARCYLRGWPTEFRNGQWVSSDTGKPDDGKRPCRRCKEAPTPEGYDACLEYIPGAISACCGHGVEEPFILPGLGGGSNSMLPGLEIVIIIIETALNSVLYMATKPLTLVRHVNITGVRDCEILVNEEIRCNNYCSLDD